MGLGGEGGEQVLGDHGVLVAAQGLLDRAHPAGQWFGAGQLGGVTGAFGGLAGGVQGLVAGRALVQRQRPVQSVAGAALLTAEQALEFGAAAPGPAPQRRVGGQLLHGCEQREVPFTVEDFTDFLMGRRIPLPEPLGQAGRGVVQRELGWQLFGCRGQPLPGSLGIPRGSQHLPQPTEFDGDVGSSGLAQQASAGREAAAQPPGADPHLVHGIGFVPAHRTVQGEQLGALAAQVGGEGGAGAARCRCAEGGGVDQHGLRHGGGHLGQSVRAQAAVEGGEQPGPAAEQADLGAGPAGQSSRPWGPPSGWATTSVRSSSARVRP